MLSGRDLLTNRRFTRAALTVALFGVLFLAVNLFVIGGDAAVAGVNHYLSPILALSAALLAIWRWRRVRTQEVEGRLWLGIAAGLVLWAGAEVIWWTYETLAHENPYPSPADIFFFAGYIPIVFGLLARYRSLQAGAPRLGRTTTVVAALLIAAAVLLLVVIPILQGFDPTKPFESILNVLYPAMDLLLLILVLLVFSVYAGDFSLPWQILGIGLVFMSIGDLSFSYISWNDLYYPGGRVNLQTALSDFTYNYSYLILALGVYTASLVPEARPAATAQPPKIVAPTLPNANVLVFTDGTDKVISVSNNFARLFQTPRRDYLVGAQLGQALGLSEAISSSLFKHLSTRGYVINQPVRVMDAGGESHAVALTAIAVRDGAGTFKGAQVLLRTHLPDENPDRELTWESQKLVEYILVETGIQEEESQQQLRAYFAAHIHLYYNLANQVGGARLSERMENLLNETAQQRRWNVAFSGGEVTIGGTYGAMNLAEILSALLRAGRVYLAGVAHPEMIDNEIETLNKRLDGKLLRAADHYRLRSESDRRTP